MNRILLLSMVLALFCAIPLPAEPPSVAYIFPAGGQRGTVVNVRIGGHYLHDKAAWEMLGQGVTASAEITAAKRIWFEGPLIRQPASQQKEDYPRDYAAQVTLAADALPGRASWRVMNGQGATPAEAFMIGDLPEVVFSELVRDIVQLGSVT